MNVIVELATTDTYIRPNSSLLATLAVTGVLLCISSRKRQTLVSSVADLKVTVCVKTHSESRFVSQIPDQKEETPATLRRSPRFWTASLHWNAHQS